MAVLATETWTGANGAAWPAQWTVNAVTGGPVNIQSNAGALGASTTAWTIGSSAYLSGMAATVNIDITVDMAFTSLAQQWCGMFVRVTANPGGAWPSDGYFLGIDPSMANSMYVARRVGGTETNVSTADFGGSWTANTFRRIRFQAIGNNLKVKVWASASAEPATWTWEGTDSSHATRSGRVFFTSSNGLNTAAKSWRLDNLTVTDGAAEPVNLTASATLGGSGTLTAGGVIGYSRSAALGGQGDLVATPRPGYLRTAALGGSGQLTTSSTAIRPVTADLFGSGSLAATAGSPGFAKAVSIVGQGTLAAGPSLVTASTVAELSGTGGLTTVSRMLLVRAVDLSGSGSLSVGAVGGQRVTAQLSGIGALSVFAGSTGSVTVLLTGAGQLSTGITRLTVSPAVSLGGVGTLTPAFTRVTARTTAALGGEGTLAVLARRHAAFTVKLTGSGLLVATHEGAGPPRPANQAYVWTGTAWTPVTVFAWRDSWRQTGARVL